MDHNTLLEKFPGYAGWGQTEALADFKATGGSGKKAPSPEDRQRQLIERQRAEQTAFYNDYTTGLEEIRTKANADLGLPKLRQTVQTTGDAARFASRALQDLPGQITGTGRAASVNANRLGRGISKGIADLQPGIETARRGLEDAIANQQFGETEYTRRLQEYAQPLQMKAGMLSESLGREFSGFTKQMQNELQLTLQKLSNNQAVTMAEINRANQLAEAEADHLRRKDLISYQSQQDISKQQQLKKATGAGAGTGTSNALSYLNRSGGVEGQSYGPTNSQSSNTNSGGYTVGQQPTLPGGMTIPNIPPRSGSFLSGYDFGNLKMNLNQQLGQPTYSGGMTTPGSFLSDYNFGNLKMNLNNK